MTSLYDFVTVDKAKLNAGIKDLQKRLSSCSSELDALSKYVSFSDFLAYSKKVKYLKISVYEMVRYFKNLPDNL